ncbi:hypothetical protein ACIP98_04830 [Streptomyces sp. NPDC088354]|uniref:hypothetical protein n=1 Tax=unclassified Streptomyces TaxID=2593676 RepID=UPI0029A0B28C|nr:hypothetical protein [Streptomyces sp. MI02-7b]MDX3072025.1 hypothetical protein [Streptomyces sp. MI02-7b]
MEFLWVLYGVLLIAAVVMWPRLRRGRAEWARAAADPALYGFVSQDMIDIRLPGPDPELTQALTATQRTQDWHAVSALLKGTPVEGEARWQRVQTLAGAAAVELTRAPGKGGAWLRTWRVEEPEDPGGAAVQAAFLVQQARRAPASSPDVPMILEEARTVAAEAVLLAPGDPVPYIVDLAADGDFTASWEKITARAPHHMGAHLVALSRLPEDAARDFAERAAASGPEGSLLPALPLFQVFAHLPELILTSSFYQSEVISRAVGGALYATEHASSNDPVLPLVRHLLISFLVRAERYPEAVEQLRHVDGFAGAAPWSYADDPAAAYALYRAQAIAGLQRNSAPGPAR